MPMNPPPAAPLPRRLAVFLLLVFLAVLIRTAWLSDDGLISLRTVMNVTHGFGLTQNVGERVQTFTHPLWLLLLTLASLAIGNVYYAAFLLGGAVSLAAVWLVVTRAASREQAVVVAVALICSRAFVDFSTSGLENPLSYLLLALFVGAFANAPGGGRQPGWSDAGDARARQRWLTRLVTLASLLYLTRPDEILIVGPLLAVACWRVKRAGAVTAAVAIGALPAAAWTLFSLAYYGFPFPNTAYAKLTHGIDQAELWRQGMLYLIDSLDRDPVTLLFVAFAVVVGATHRAAMSRALAVGIVLYLAYVMRVGGDFMAGRFIAVPMFAAALLVGRLPADQRSARDSVPAEADPGAYSRGTWIAAATVLAVVAAASAMPPIRSDSRFDQRMAKNNGIVDERAFYFKTNSLMHATRESFSQPEWVAKRPAGGARRHVLETCGLMGSSGLEFGPGTFLLDECALADPLLARLPAVYNETWRPGHFRRMVPAGYASSLRASDNQLEDPKLREYYDKLRLIVQSPDLFARDRLDALVKMNLGFYKDLIDYDTYRYGGPIRSLEDVAEAKPDETPWNAPGVYPLTETPLIVGVEDRPGRRFLDISLDSNDKYRIVFLKRHRKIAHVDVGPIPQRRRGPGLASFTVDLPQRAVIEGFDTVFVTMTVGTDNAYAVGHLLLDRYAPTNVELWRRVAQRDGVAER